MAGNKNSGGHNRKPAFLHAVENTGRTTRGTNEKQQVKVPNVEEFSHEAWLTGKKLPTRQEIFKRLQVWCDTFGLKSQADVMALTIFAETYHSYLKLQQIVNEQGVHASLGERNQLALPQLNAARKEVLTLMQNYGMTPQTRHILNPTGADGEDPVENLFITKRA